MADSALQKKVFDGPFTPLALLSILTKQHTLHQVIRYRALRYGFIFRYGFVVVPLDGGKIGDFEIELVCESIRRLPISMLES